MKSKLLIMAASAALTSCGTTQDSDQDKQDLIGRSSIQINDRELTPEALWSMGRIGGLTVSPDSKQFVYSVSYYSVPQNKSNTELFTMNADGSDHQ